MGRPSLLLVDDRELERELIDRTLSLEGYGVTSAAAGAEALELLESRAFDAAIIDASLLGVDGLDLLRQIKRRDPTVDVVILTAQPSVEAAVEALKQGASDYIAKPLDLDELRDAVGRVSQRRLLLPSVTPPRRKLGEGAAARELVGVSRAMSDVREVVMKAAPTDCPVLIEGESGTGKELVAAAIHRLSSRATGPFVAVNCGSIPAGLVESELFGHVRGAFSGAVANAPGLFRSAAGGTIFLDEVVELLPVLQTKLLRVLQGSEVRPVGSTRFYPVDARVIAATNRPLDEAVRNGSLRADFFYRLNVIRITMPPLRKRRADVPALVHHFLRRFNERFDRTVTSLAPDAMAALVAYDFPGNVRELENFLEHAYVVGTGDQIELADLPVLRPALPEIEAFGEFAPLGWTIERVERDLIARALQIYGHDKEKAARSLGVSSRTLHRRIKAYNLSDVT